jgi:Asp-tRNA(Asn)/Glu-tRNA(Gln) amidotransferase A subunit family amidase
MNEPDTRGDRRRDFLRLSTIAGAAALTTGRLGAAPLRQDEAAVPPGIDVAAILGGERLLGLEFTPEEREQMLARLAAQLRIYDGLRAITPDLEIAPAEIFDPRLPGQSLPTRSHPAKVGAPARATLPGGANADEEIAFASLVELSHWIASRQLSSERLTALYLERLARIGERLHCVVTLLREPALERARSLDRELIEGQPRSPLHGIPYGAKDLFDTAGIATTFGAEPFRDRVPSRDATVISKLDAAGAVLIAKLSLGALAYGDQWFGGRTRNPFDPEQGSSGSSAGSAAAVAAGLVGFALGTETYGSIGSPAARCGATGLRPSFGRISRAGAMALCWSLDKVGPLARSVEDCALVLDALNGKDLADPASLDVPLAIDLTDRKFQPRIGYFPAEYETATAADRESIDRLQEAGCEVVRVAPPRIPGPPLIELIIAVESAAQFDRLTRDGRDDELSWQDERAWPNLFRAARFIPAVEFQQARRLRRVLMEQTAQMFSGLEAIIAPQSHGPMHAITNLTGHPAITIRQAFRDDGTPGAVTLWGELFEDGKLLATANLLENALGYRARRPAL